MKTLVMSLLFILVASLCSAQYLPINRYVILTTYSDQSVAASDLASGSPGSFLFTGSTAQPVISFRILYADLVYVPQPIVPTNWLEFRLGDPTTASRCQGIPTVSRCAAIYYDFYRARSSYAGEVSTTEGSVIVWWF